MAPPRSSTALHANTSSSGHATETVQTRDAKRAVGLTTEPAAGQLLHHRVAVGVRPPAVQHATQAPRVHPAHKLSAPRRIDLSVADNAPAGPASNRKEQMSAPVSQAAASTLQTPAGRAGTPTAGSRPQACSSSLACSEAAPSPAPSGESQPRSACVGRRQAAIWASSSSSGVCHTSCRMPLRDAIGSELTD